MPKKIAVFETSETTGQDKCNEFLARPDIVVDNILASACGSKWGYRNYVTIVYRQSGEQQ